MNRTKLNEVFLIDEELLKNYSNMSRNVGVDKVIPYINLAQPMYVEPVLGTALMEELQMQIDSGEVSEANQALLLKIAPALALWTDYLAARRYSYTVTQKGITKEKSENSESLNEKELGYFIHSIREDAENATELLIKYLCRCQDQYPLFRPSSNCDCAKYLEENTGDADPKKKFMIYFPFGKRSKCPDCSRY